MGRQLTRFMDSTLNQLDLGRGTACAIHVFIISSSVLLSVYPILCYFGLSKNVHVAFWLGSAPEFVNLLVPGSLACVSLVTPTLQCMNARQHKVKGTLLTAFVIAGSLIVVAGLWVAKEAHEVSTQLLTSCGSSPDSARLEKEWQRLAEFQRKCARRSRELDIYIQQCPGFTALLAPPHGPDVEYLERLEVDFACQGFCDFKAQPLFVGELEGGPRCASAIGEEMSNVGYLVSVPTMAIGTIVLAIGGCFAGYDHL